MSGYVWWTPVARKAIEALTPAERERFDHIAEYLAFSPFPEPGTTNIHRTRLYEKDLLIFFNNDFPYAIYYRVEGDDIHIELVLRSFVS